MFRADSRLVHFAILIAAHVLLTFPNLGRASLWDDDEGLNAEAAREMVESGNYVSPTFNYKLRTAKPVLLYWARLRRTSCSGTTNSPPGCRPHSPAWVTLLARLRDGTPHLRRRAGLLSALILASTLEFGLIAHAATPDGLLLVATTATMCFFRRVDESGNGWWYVPAGAAAGVAVLAKGPIGLALPGLIVLVYLGWERRWSVLADRRLGWGVAACLLVAVPWYVLVAVETKGEWVRKFFLNEYVNRALEPLERHDGPIFFHVAGILVLFAPWSVFAWPTLRSATRDARSDRERSGARLLLCWAGVTVAVFSLAATKLPNYVLPAYPPLAVLTGVYLDRWRRGVSTVGSWAMPTAAGWLIFVAFATAGGLMVAGEPSRCRVRRSARSPDWPRSPSWGCFRWERDWPRAGVAESCSNADGDGGGRLRRRLRRRLSGVRAGRVRRP